MKPVFQKIILDAEESFTLREWRHDPQECHLRFNTGYSMLMMIKGRGIRCIGDKVERFQDRELVLLGPKIPFYWHGDAGEKRFHYITATFDEDFLCGMLLKVPEAAGIRTLLSLSRRGLAFPPEVYARVAPDLLRACKATGWERLSLFLDILNRLAGSPKGRTIVSAGFPSLMDESDAHRLSAVCQYVHKFYGQKISESAAAKLAGFSRSSFSRYFRRRMHRTFVAYINEVRIGEACRKLVDDDLTITQIAFECGYNSLSVFYLNFRKIIGVTPKEYRLARSGLEPRPKIPPKNFREKLRPRRSKKIL